MKKSYLDVVELDECTSVFAKDVDIISAGTTISSMPVEYRNQEYQRYADEYDVHFIFDDHIPRIDFYAVPQVDIMAVDSNGGYIGTRGQISDLDAAEPICYIDSEKKCFLAAQNGRDFLKNIATWKNRLKPYHDITFYGTKAEAEKELEFIDTNKMSLAAPGLFV